MPVKVGGVVLLRAGLVGHQRFFGWPLEVVVATVFRINQLGVEVVEYHQQPVSNIKEHFTLQVSLGSWLPINDAVEILGVSRKTVYTYIKSEKLITKKEFGKRFVWIEDSVDVSPVSTSDKITQGNNNSSVQKILIAKLKMEIELLERTLVVKEEHVDSLKQEVNRLSILLMLEKRSIFARVKDYFIGSTFRSRSKIANWLKDLGQD